MQISRTYYADVAAATTVAAPFPFDVLQAPALTRHPKTGKPGAFLTLAACGETVGDIKASCKVGGYAVLDDNDVNVRGAAVPLNMIEDRLITRMFVLAGTNISVSVRNTDGANAAEARVFLGWEA